MLGGTTAYLVCYAVEDLHGQVGHLRERVCSQMKQDPPDLSVNAVEGHTWNKKTQQKSNTRTHVQLMDISAVCLRARFSDCGVTLTTPRPSSLTGRGTKRLTRANSYMVMQCSSHKHHVTRSGHFLILQLSDVLRWQRENDLQCQVMYIINHSVHTHIHTRARTHTLQAAGFPHLLFCCC